MSKSMFKHDYTNLTLAQVRAAVEKGQAPETAGICDCCRASCLAGTEMKIILDKEPVEGPVLEYAFKDDKTLTLKENGGAPVTCSYGAVKFQDFVLFSHTLPGTLRGWTVAANTVTGVVTASEMWFIDYEGKDLRGTGVGMMDAMKMDPFVNRESQRQLYTGYIDSPAIPVPEKRAHLTLRMDNRMMYWEDTLGRRHLVTYATSLFSTFVDVGVSDGEDVLCFPSDVLQLNDSLFFYCRGEVEFSGRFVFEIIDINEGRKAGVTFGFDEEDKYEYKLYTAKGRTVGNLATFFDFNDDGDKRSPNHTNRMDFSKRGTRPSYRPSIMSTKLTPEQLDEAAKDTHLFVKLTNPTETHSMSSSNFMEESTVAVGKTIVIKGDDGFASEYRFLEKDKLEYRAPGETKWHEEMFHAFALDTNLVCLGHYRLGVFPPTSRMVFLDFDNGLATVVESYIGGKRDLHDVVPAYHFGTFSITAGGEDFKEYPAQHHCFTRELLGRSFTWTYSKMSTSQHIYNAPHSYSWTIINNTAPGDPMNRAGGFVWSGPCEYLKFRDKVYAMLWVEERWKGMLACAAINEKLMHDCGFSFGIGMDGKSVMFDIMGAMARNAGKADLDEIFKDSI